jgi:hypothetical protein
MKESPIILSSSILLPYLLFDFQDVVVINETKENQRLSTGVLSYLSDTDHNSLASTSYYFLYLIHYYKYIVNVQLNHVVSSMFPGLLAKTFDESVINNSWIHSSSKRYERIEYLDGVYLSHKVIDELKMKAADCLPNRISSVFNSAQNLIRQLCSNFTYSPSICISQDGKTKEVELPLSLLLSTEGNTGCSYYLVYDSISGKKWSLYTAKYSSISKKTVFLVYTGEMIRKEEKESRYQEIYDKEVSFLHYLISASHFSFTHIGIKLCIKRIGNISSA